MLCAIGPTAIKILRVLLDSRDRAARLEKCAGAAPAYASQTPAGKSAKRASLPSGQVCQVMDARPCLRAPHPVRRRAAALVRQSTLDRRALEAPAARSPMVISLASGSPKLLLRGLRRPPACQNRRLPRKQPAKPPWRPRSNDRCGAAPCGSSSDCRMPRRRGGIGLLPPMTAVERSRRHPTSCAMIRGLKLGQVSGSSGLSWALWRGFRVRNRHSSAVSSYLKRNLNTYHSAFSPSFQLIFLPSA